MAFDGSNRRTTQPIAVGLRAGLVAIRAASNRRSGTHARPSVYDRGVPEPEPANRVAMHKFAPIFPVSDLAATLAFYSRLGFTTNEYTGESAAGGYGFARRDSVELHLGTIPDGRTMSPVTAYLHVEDADSLAAEWREAGTDVRSPEDTPWGQHEGVIIDPDGNIIRFGSPI